MTTFKRPADRIDPTFRGRGGGGPTWPGTNTPGLLAPVTLGTPIPSNPIAPGLGAQSGRQQLYALFDGFQLPRALADWAWQQVLDGRELDEVLFLAQDRPEWKERFIGNEERRKLGLPVLDPSQYLAIESSYKALYRNYGLPGGLYDDPKDFARLIGLDVSPSELEARLDIGVERVRNVAPEVRWALQSYYGINERGLLSYVLDPERGIKELDRQFRAAEIGGAAKISGLRVNQRYAERLAATGLDFGRAAEGFQQVGAEQELQGRRAFGAEQLTTRDLADAVFFGDRDILERIRRSRLVAYSSVGGGGALSGERGAVGLGRA